MDEYEAGHRGHPVITGAVTAATTLAARNLARAYLVRAFGEEAADAFFRKVNRRLWAGIIVPAALVIVAVFVSYASLAAADGITLAAVVLVFVLIGPPVFTVLGYASRQARYLKQCGSSYLH